MTGSCLRYSVLAGLHKLSLKFEVLFRLFSGFIVQEFLPSCANVCIYSRFEIRPTKM